MNQKILMFLLITVVALQLQAANSFCETCHKQITPEIVRSFNRGRMADGITCIDCHGQKHDSADNSEKAQMPDVHTCAGCHGEQVAHLQSGRHHRDLAEVADVLQNYHTAVSTEHCVSCHRDSRSVRQADFGGGKFACLTCHQPHTFMNKQEKGPQICKTCHNLGKNSVWQVWAGSPHGQHYFSKKEAGAKAPYCQTCHMNDGDHRMESRWGAWDLNLFIRDTEWQKSQHIIRKALFPAVSSEYRLLLNDSIRSKRIGIRYFQVCQSCHAAEFVAAQRRKTDGILKHADGLMSAAIAIAARLQPNAKGLLQRSVPGEKLSPLKRMLHKMFYEYRRRVYRAALHLNYGLAEKALQSMANELTALKKFIRRPQ